MPSILSDEDKQTVKRTVPKASNKIHAVAVAKLYIAYPNRQQWTYTGLQGAAVLADDLVGNTFWLKLVDVSPSNRGVIWDQEVYDTFAYKQDRTFFHSFEGEECMFGLSFADEKEAKQFLKKVSEREKNAHKSTRAKPFASGPAQSNYGAPQSATVGNSGKSGLFGGLFSLHRHNHQNQAPAQSIIPPRGIEITSHAPSPAPSGASRPGSASGIDLSDPQVQAVLRELQGMGITEDQIEENAAFIKTYLEQHKATAAAEAEKRERSTRAPPPPPPAGVPAGIANLSPQNTGGSGNSKRGPPPAPPPSRRAAPGPSPSIQRPPSPSPSPPRASSPPRPRFRAPPPIADAGKFANDSGPPSLPNRDRTVSQGAANGPPPPPRPPKTPLDDTPTQSTRFAVPPPFEGTRLPSGPPPSTPARGGVPPPPPPRDNAVPAITGLPPPPPPRTANTAVNALPPPPPPLPPSSSRPIPPTNGIPPPPPPLPPTAPSSGLPPPPPPMPATSSAPSGPLPPPMPPRGGGADTAAPPLPSAASAGRGGLLADIRGGARLRKVADSEKSDRSGAIVPGGETAAATTSSGGGDAQGGLAGALANALAVRKSKVSHSDDENDDDDW